MMDENEQKCYDNMKADIQRLHQVVADQKALIKKLELNASVNVRTICVSEDMDRMLYELKRSIRSVIITFK